MKRKLISVLLAVSMVATMAVGCGGKKRIHHLLPMTAK